MTNSISTYSTAYLQHVQIAKAEQLQHPVAKPAQQQQDSVQLSAQAQAAVAGSITATAVKS
jgi:hypothetical protein